MVVKPDLQYVENFIKKPTNENIIHCLNAERINKKII